MTKPLSKLKNLTVSRTPPETYKYPKFLDCFASPTAEFRMYKTYVSVSLKISKFMVLGHIHINRLLNCCSDMMTSCSQIKAAYSFTTLQWADIKHR